MTSCCDLNSGFRTTEQRQSEEKGTKWESGEDVTWDMMGLFGDGDDAWVLTHSGDVVEESSLSPL